MLYPDSKEGRLYRCPSSLHFAQPSAKGKQRDVVAESIATNSGGFPREEFHC
jgi:hypothetical protein